MTGPGPGYSVIEEIARIPILGEHELHVRLEKRDGTRHGSNIVIRFSHRDGGPSGRAVFVPAESVDAVVEALLLARDRRAEISGPPRR